MEKPITLVMKELKTKMVNNINESGLPLFALESVVKGLYEDIANLAAQQAKAEEAKYYEELKKEQTEQNTVTETV